MWRHSFPHNFKQLTKNSISPCLTTKSYPIDWESKNNNNKDAVDADLVNTYKPTGNKEQWNTMRVGRLIDALAENLPTSGELQAPIYRTGRTYPSLGGLNFNQLAQTGAGSIISSNLLEQEGGANLVMAPIGISSQMQPLHGLVWAPPSTRPLTLPPPFYGSSTGGGNKSQKLISGSGPTTSGSRARVQHVNSGGGGGGGEFAFQTPELKRVENSRWNNLRGMWGKRSDNSINQLSSPAPDDAQLDQ